MWKAWKGEELGGKFGCLLSFVNTKVRSESDNKLNTLCIMQLCKGHAQHLLSRVPYPVVGVNVH